MEDKFVPKDIELKMYKNWEEKGYFKCNIEKDKKPFVVVMPPPNVTGKLHMGHALDQCVQDIFIRYNRLKGVPTLWIPGTDHASIATEVKVVNKLKEQGISKYDLGREKFLEEAFAWKEEYGNEIKDQIRKLGSSCDWEKERFTMDEVCTEAVLEAFVKLYEEGYIYRSERIVNWCPSCKTTISETEVDYQENKGNIWHIRYYVEESDESIVVATTRPETILGDTAVAVNPKDDRYKHLVGKKVILPLTNRTIEIIADDYVESDFKTGVVKITPAHDPNDFLVGQRHNLETIKIMNEDATLNENAFSYCGMSRYEARAKIVEDLEKLGNLVEVEEYTNNVGSCYRCNSVIEPYLSLQWFVKMQELAKPAIEAVKNDEIKFIPKRFEKNYYHWMESIQDWCISRQLWWGHQIPIYYCDVCDKLTVSKTKVVKCSCGGNLTQDKDCLDTWFSSALWPFSVLGWPEKSEELEYFYPTTTLVTGYDIITFWVSKMIFSGLKYMDEKPFENIYIHGIVRDSNGLKMSKSLGNGIDPLDVIEEFGADALRFSLIQNTTPGNDIRYLEEKVSNARNFINKLWNATKFMKMYLSDELVDVIKNMEKEDRIDFLPEDEWIINKLNKIIDKVSNNIDNFEIGVALNELYTFSWFEFCDWYIEMIKPRLYKKEGDSFNIAIYTLNYVIKSIVKLLHPFMPFVTEEIYLNLVHNCDSLMVSSYPLIKYDASKSDVVDDIISMISNIRNIRSERNILNSKKMDIIVMFKENSESIFNFSSDYIKKLASIENIEFITSSVDNLEVITLKNFNVYIDVNSLIDKEEEIVKIESSLLEANNIIEKAKKMLENEAFVSKAPKKVIDVEKDKIIKYEEIIINLEKRLKEIKVL